MDLNSAIEYIKSQLQAGKTAAQITSDLEAAGWSHESVVQALSQAQSPVSEAKPPVGDYFSRVLTGQKKFHVFLAGIVLGLLITIKPSFYLIKYGLPYINNLESQVVSIVDEVFPQDLEITIKDGIASTNVKEPYHIDVNRAAIERIFNFQDSHPPATTLSKIRFITLNTQGKAEDFDKFQSVAMLTARSLVYYSDGDVKIQPLSKTPNIVLSQKTLKNKIYEYNANNRLTNFFRTLIYISPVAIILFYPVIFMVNTLSKTFLAWVINKLLSTGIPFGRLYGLTGVLNFVTELILVVLAFVPGISLFRSWLAVAFNAITLALCYFFIYRHHKNL